MNTVNQARNAEIVHRRKAGEWPRAIARDMGLSHNVVIGVCNRAGLSSPAGKHMCLRGEALPHSLLATHEVQQIRRNYVPYSRDAGAKAFAERFGVSVYAIRAIVEGRNWKHVA